MEDIEANVYPSDNFGKVWVKIFKDIRIDETGQLSKADITTVMIRLSEIFELNAPTEDEIDDIIGELDFNDDNTVNIEDIKQLAGDLMNVFAYKEVKL